MKKPPQRKNPPRLSINSEIDDIHIWFVQINGNEKMPCRKTTLAHSFMSQAKDLDVKVLARWIKGDSKQFEIIK